MSRIGQILELKAMRQAIDDLKRSQSERERITENLITCVGELRARVQELEAKRGPGRPKKE